MRFGLRCLLLAAALLLIPTAMLAQGTVVVGAGGSGVIQRPGGVITVVDPLNWTGTLVYKEDFVFGAVCQTGAPGRPCGETNWYLSGPASVTMTAGTLGVATQNHPGLRTINTAATGGTAVTLEMTAAANTLDAAAAFDTIYVVRSETDDADTTVRIGLVDGTGGANPSDTGVYFEMLGGEANWQLVCRTAAVQTRTDTGVVFAATTFYTMRIRRVNATTIGYAVCSGSACTLPAESTTTTNCPTASTQELHGSFQVRTGVAASKAVTVDYFDLIVAGGIVR